MKFSFEHHLEAPVAEVAAALLDRRFQESLGDVGSLKERRVLAQEVSPDGAATRRIRCVLGIDLGPARAFVGDLDPAWVEEATWDPTALVWRWVIVPEVAADLLDAHGSIELAEDATGTRRSVAGEVIVKVPLYGNKVEGRIVEGLRAAYDEEAARLARFLEERQLPS